MKLIVTWISVRKDFLALSVPYVFSFPEISVMSFCGQLFWR